MIFDTVSPPLDDTDFVVQSLHEARGHLVIGMTVTDNAVPVTVDHSGEFLKRLKALPAQLILPILERFASPCRIVVCPELLERFFKKLRPV